MTKVRRSSLPDLTDTSPAAIRTWARSVKEAVGVLTGDAARTTDAWLDSAVTFRDLVSGGFATLGSGGRFVPDYSGIVIPGGGGEYVPPDPITPPAPTGLTATGMLGAIFLDWVAAAYTGHAYTEIFRATVDDFGQAVRTGITTGSLYTDYVGDGETYYYWIRFVSVTDTVGPLNAIAGTPGTSALDPTYLLDVLNGALSESQLNATLNARIDLIDTPTSGLVDVVAGINTDLGNLDSQVQSIDNQINAATTGLVDLVATLDAILNGDVLTPGTVDWRIDAATSSLVSQSELTTELASYVTNAYLTNNYYTATATDAAIAAAVLNLVSTTQLNTALADYTTTAQLQAAYYSSTETDSAIAAATLNLVSDTELTTALSSYVTNATLTNNYYTITQTDSAIAAAVLGLASQTWVNTQLGSYVTNATLTANYYTETETDSAIAAAVLGLASQTWVNTQLGSYVTSATLTANYYTETETDSAIAAAVTGLASQTWVNTQLGSYVTSANLTANYYTKTATDSAIAAAVLGLAAESWVTTQLGSYVTSAALTAGYYTKTATDSAIANAVLNLVSTTQLNTALASYTNTATLEANYYTSTEADSAISAAVTGLASETWVNTNYYTKSYITTNFYTKSGTDGAIATAITQVDARLDDFNGATGVTVEQAFTAQASDITGLEGKYTVKVDANGYVSGFGLASVANNGTTVSEFQIVADKFSIAPVASNPTAADGSPFYYITSPTSINGVTVPAGAYIKRAFIAEATIGTLQVANAAITEAKIANLAVTDAKIASLSADKITAGDITALRMQANVLTALQAGIANLAAISATLGTVKAGNITIDTDGGYLQAGKTSYASTAAGFWMGRDGTAYKFIIGNATNYIRWTGTALEVVGQIISTASIQSNAVSDIQSQFTATATLAGTSWATIATVTITYAGSGTIMLYGQATIEAEISALTNPMDKDVWVEMQLVRDSSTVLLSLPVSRSMFYTQDGGGVWTAIFYESPSIKYRDTPTSGSHTYTLQIRKGGTYTLGAVDVKNRFLSAEHLKR